MNFSVVVPTRNRQYAVIRCLRSIDKAATKYNGSVEVICINNNSTDDTEKKIKKFTGQKIVPNLLEVKRLGPSYARNAGIRKAKYKHIIFIDDDCVISSNYFNFYQKAWKAHPTAALIGGKVEVKKNSRNPLSVYEQRVLYNHSWCFGSLDFKKDRMLKYGECLHGANMSMYVKKEKSLFYFDEQLGRQLKNGSIIYGEDYELSNRLILSGEQVLYIDRVVVTNCVVDSRFKPAFILSRYYYAGIEQRIVEDILSQKYKNNQAFYTYFSPVRQAMTSLIKLQRVTGSIKLIINNFASFFSIVFAVSYLMYKYEHDSTNSTYPTN